MKIDNLRYSRHFNELRYSDSNDASYTILKSGYPDGSWGNEIEIFSDRYSIKMDSYESGWIYDSIFSPNSTLRIQMYILLAGDYPSYFWKAGFDNLHVTTRNSSYNDSGLIAYWSFNDGTATDNVGSHDGDLYGNPSYLGSGGPDGSGCFDLDGIDDYIRVPSSSDWDFGSADWTYSIFVKSSQTNGYFPFFHVGDGDYAEWQGFMGIRQEFDGAMADTLRIRSAVFPDLCDFYLSNSYYDGDWHLLTVVRNSNNLFVYWDAQQITDVGDVTGKSFGNSSYDVYMGHGKFRDPTDSFYADGLIDVLLDATVNNEKPLNIKRIKSKNRTMC